MSGTLAEHWDGSSWLIVPAQGYGSSSSFSSVAALASNDIWAVGRTVENHTTLTEHWDGQMWSIVPSPNPNPDNGLSGITAHSADDIWAVGYTDVISGGFSAAQTLIEHWDGTSWQVIPSPNYNPPNSYQPNNLFAVAATSPTDAWAVGNYDDYTDNGKIKDLIEHWDGTNWQVVPAPFLGSSDRLWGVAALTANDAWAVGSYDVNPGLNLLALHWDGSSWQPTNVPYPDTDSNGLRGVVALSHNDVWAVGDYFGAVPNRTLVEHWDGSSWQVFPSPSDDHYDTLFSITAVSNYELWAVGGRYPTNPGTLAEHYGCISPTATPTAASATPTTSATPTATSPPTDTPTASVTPMATMTFTSIPTNTASATPQNTVTPIMTATLPVTATPTLTATPTPLNTATATNTPAPNATTTPTDCANPFVDINANIFYAAIHQLNCAGVINGTDASHYTPAGTATRGQFAKIVVLGFGLPLLTPTNGQTFTDVPASYFAYLYIESGYATHILSGYDPASCVAAGAIWPCYLPNVAISRAQLTKLVVGAAGYPLLTPSGGPSFSDVPPSNVFYASIETAHAHGIVNGYPDGTFHPSQSIRRDEMAQIVYSAR